MRVSFALGIVLTPVVIFQEAHRLYKANTTRASLDLAAMMQLAGPSLIGMVLSFLAGLLALLWLPRWLERGALVLVRRLLPGCGAVRPLDQLLINA